jgi:hypothetical protein
LSILSGHAKNAHFIETIRLSIQNGQNGQANGQVFVCTLPSLSLPLHANENKSATIRDGIIRFLP